VRRARFFFVKRRNAMKTWGVVAALWILVAPSRARADDDRFAPPPPGDAASVAYDEDGSIPPIARAPERPRSAVRVALGPAAVTTGHGLGVGVGGGLDIGNGSVGGRLSATWTRGEPGGGGTSVVSESFAQYEGELVLDLHKRGPLHPLLGVGFGVVRGESARASGVAGVGLLRAGIEYALGFEEADVRLGAAATGGLVGPADHELQSLRGHALLGAYVAIGL
jgi:hypothetical protein